jgi:YVTN family beta-propeller protein
VTPDGSTVYVSNYGGNTVSVISTATDTVTTVIHDPSFNFPWGVAVTPVQREREDERGAAGGREREPDGSKIYVGNNGPSFDGNTVSVIDTATNTVTETITLPNGKGPNAVAVTPDGSQVYVNNDSDIGGVSVIATATKTVGSIPTVDGFTTGVAVTPDGRKVYVVNGHSDNVSVIATAKNMVVGSPIPVGNFPAANGVFIQPRFAGTPGKANCFGQSVSALARTFGGFSSAATALGFSDVKGLQKAILAFCEE